MKIKEGSFLDKFLTAVAWPEIVKQNKARNEVIDEVKEQIPKKYHKTLEDMKR